MNFNARYLGYFYLVDKDKALEAFVYTDGNHAAHFTTRT